MDRPTFTFKQVDAILAHVFRVLPGKRRTFMARLQQMQKLGLPPGTNVGRGARVAYETWQLAEMQLYLDLLNVGLTPAMIVSFFGDYAFYLDERHQGLAEGCPARPMEGAYLGLQVGAIDHLSRDNASHPSAHEEARMVVSIGLARLMEQPMATPAIVISLSERLATLRESIAIVQPNLAAERLFPDVRLEFT
jgi:hypothetical protein